MKDEEDRPKAPPNDPQRQGNIWQRYEQLERSAKSLADVNQQMALEKAKHQRVCHILPSWTPSMQPPYMPCPHLAEHPALHQPQADSMESELACLDVIVVDQSVNILTHAMQDKKRLEEEVLELQRVNASLVDAASGHGLTSKRGSPPVLSCTAESATSLSEGGSRQRSYCPVSSLPLPTSAQPDKEEVCITACSLHTHSAESATLCVARALQHHKHEGFSSCLLEWYILVSQGA